MIIGRDHAGVGDYYGPFDAQKIFDEIPKGALKCQNLNIDWTFWCYKCGGMASMKTCPHGKDDRLMLSGTVVRKTLSEGGEASRGVLPTRGRRGPSGVLPEAGQEGGDQIAWRCHRRREETVSAGTCLLCLLRLLTLPLSPARGEGKGEGK